jgi:hypothetical protein
MNSSAQGKPGGLAMAWAKLIRTDVRGSGTSWFTFLPRHSLLSEAVLALQLDLPTIGYIYFAICTRHNTLYRKYKNLYLHIKQQFKHSKLNKS